ncbi:MAG: hypothetical protein L3J69_18295 [Desulfobacula sp.]|nr:hypothetical protein [Desulfobacula sp.]
MAESVKVLPENYQKMMTVYKWDLRTLEGVKRFKEIGAKSLPSIAMDGAVVYSSIIPGQEDLGREIRRRYQEKNQKMP